MPSYAYHHVITPPNYLVPTDPYQLQQQQQQQQMQNHFAAVAAAAAAANPASSQMNRPLLPSQKQHLPSLSQSSLPYPSPYAPPAPLSQNYNYAQSAPPANPYMPQQQQQQVQPQPQQAQRLPSLTQQAASRQASYSGLPDMHTYQYHSNGNSYQLPYPKKGLTASSSASFSQSQIGSYSLNGTTFYVPSVPSVPFDHGDFIARPQQQPSQQAYSQQKQYPPQQHYSANNNEGAVTGGVAAKLDYNLDEMSEFIAIKSLDIMSRYPAMLKPELAAQSFVDSFTKFTCQVLTATRLPKSTLVLALVYLSDRWSKGNLPETQSPIHDVYKMLVVALLLANKFHDDNTFTNKSWHEATGVPVTDLRVIEADWLRAIQWTLHLEKSAGWDEWNQIYEYWIANHRKSASAAAAAAAYKSPYASPVRSAYPISPASSPEANAMSNDRAQALYSSPPPLSSYSYSKWYPGNAGTAAAAAAATAAGAVNSTVSIPSSTPSSSIASTLSRSSSISTLATPPSSRGNSYAPYFAQQQPYGGCHYDDNMYHHRPHQSQVSSYYLPSYGGVNCNCNHCTFDSVPKVHWGSNYSYAAAC